MEKIIPESAIAKQKLEKKPIKSECVKNDSFEFICLLKTKFFETDEEKSTTLITDLLKAQAYLANEVSAENENTVVLIIKSPLGKYYSLSIPKSFGKEQVINFKIDGQKISLRAVPKTNGYNTEYEINGGDNNWRQIAVLFTLINPEWKKQKQKIDKLDLDIIELNLKKQTLEKQLKEFQDKQKSQRIKGLSNKKIKVKDYSKYIDNLKREIAIVLTEISSKTKEKEIENKVLLKIRKIIDFPYTPYNRSYDNEGIRNHGFIYLKDKTRNAFEKLGRLPSFVKSNNKSILVRDAFSSDIAMTLNIVERMDFYHYYDKKGNLKPDDEVYQIMEGQINKALTTIAINQSGAFNWQRSSVGALGIGQFMPVTYNNLKNKYASVFPENYNFEDGAKDHETIFRMQGLHFNEEVIAFPSWIKSNWDKIIEDENAKIGLYSLIAAGYNGSIKRIIIEAGLGDKFDISLLYPDELLKRLGKNKETYTYVKKFIFTWRYLEKNYRDFGK